MEVDLLSVDWEKETNGYTFDGIEGAVMRYPLAYRLTVLDAIQRCANAALPFEYRHRRADNERIFFSPLRSSIRGEISQKEKSDKEKTKFTIPLIVAPQQGSDPVHADAGAAAGSFEYDRNRVMDVFALCDREDGAFKVVVTELQFETCVAKANFKALYDSSDAVKTKLMVAMHILQHAIIGDAAAWRTAAADSIGRTWAECGKSIGSIGASKWKKDATALKHKYKPR